MAPLSFPRLRTHHVPITFPVDLRARSAHHEAVTSANTPRKTPGSTRVPASRGTVREHRGALELRAYAGINPATGTRQYLTKRLPLGTADKVLGRELTALVARADDLVETRRARRKDGYTQPEPARANRDRTVGHALETWWNAHGSTLDGATEIRRNLDAYLIPRLGPVALWRLRPALDAAEAERDPDLVDLSALYRDLQAGGATGGGGRPHRAGRPLAPATIHKIHGILRAALALEVRRPGGIMSNPAAEVRLPRIEDRESTTPEPDELADFLPFLAGAGRTVPGYDVTRRTRTGETVTYRVEEKPDVRAAELGRATRAFALLVASGPRPQEVAAIRRGDLDLDTGRLSLTGEGVVKVKEPGQPERWEVRRGETAKRRKRAITLDPDVLAAVEDVIRAADEYALACGIRLGRRAFLFSDEPDGSKPPSPKNLSRAFDRAVAAAVRAGIDVPAGMRLYDMRHFGITQLLRAGRAVADVARRYGTSSRMIHARYAHAIPGDDHGLAATMADVWAPVRARAAELDAGGPVVALRRR